MRISWKLWLKKTEKIIFSAGKKLQPLFVKYSKWLMILPISLALADLSLLFVHPYLFPNASQKPSKKIFQPKKNLGPSVDFIHVSNIFHRGPIPQSDQPKDDFPDNQTAQPSSLSLKLLGTIESIDPRFSIASIEYNAQTQSYFTGEVIADKARITSIERRKVIFINLINNQLEYIEIPKDAHVVSFVDKKPKKKTPLKKTTYKGIQELRKNNFALSRSTINNHLKNLPDILQQARMDPKYGPNGKILGHTFTWIKEGSVFEGLGFAKGDTLVSINGTKVNDNVEATELFQQLKTSSRFTILVEDKAGSQRRLSYNVDENASQL